MAEFSFFSIELFIYRNIVLFCVEKPSFCFECKAKLRTATESVLFSSPLALSYSLVFNAEMKKW